MERSLNLWLNFVMLFPEYKMPWPDCARKLQLHAICVNVLYYGAIKEHWWNKLQAGFIFIVYLWLLVSEITVQINNKANLL